MADGELVHAGEVGMAGEPAEGAGSLVPSPPDPLAAYLDGWLGLYSENTQDAYKLDIASWRAWLAQRGGTMDRAKRVHFLAWCAHLREDVPPGRTKPLAQTTRARRESTVTSFYDYLLETEAIERSPAHGKGAKRRTKSGAPANPTPALTGDQLAEFMAAAAALGPRHLLVASVLLTTACRVSELCNADVADVRESGGDAVLAVMRKGANPDELLLPASVAAKIRTLIEGRAPSEPLVTTAEGTRLSRNGASSLLQVTGRYAGSPVKVTPHVLRTTACNLLIDEGVPMQDVQEFMAHASITTTQGYFRRFESRSRRRTMASILDDLLAA